MPQIFWITLAGMAGVLAVATTAGRVLARRAGPENATVLNLNQRINAWWVMTAVGGAALVAGKHATIALFLVCSFFALREFITLTPTKEGDYSSLVLVFYVALPAQYVVLAMEWYGLFAILIPVWGFLVISAAAAFAQDTADFLERNAKIQWALMVCVYGLSHAPALLMLRIPGYFSDNGPLLLYFLLVVQSSDVFQYICGKIWGLTPLSPKVSPNKTVEGLVGGGLLAVLLGLLLHGLTPFAPWEAALMSLVTVAAGVIGGLVLSAVKRSLGAKDWGEMLAGHGGMLDRVDSICFAAPVFFHLTRFFFVP